MALPIQTQNNTTANYAAMSPDFIPVLYDFTVQTWANTGDYMKSLEGPDKMACIQTTDKLNHGHGTKINYRTRADLFGRGVMGDEQTGDNVEQIRVASYPVTVNMLHHAVRTQKWAQEEAGWRELRDEIPDMLGAWLGRQRAHRLAMLFLHRGQPANYWFVNGRGNIDALKSADTFALDTAILAKNSFSTKGAMGFRTGKNKHTGQDIYEYCAIGTCDGYSSMKRSSEYQNLAAIDHRGTNQNFLFEGELPRYDGSVFKEVNVIDHDGWGSIGCPMNPKGLLGQAIAAGAGAVDITFGGNAAASVINTDYAEWFPNHQYKLTQNDIVDTTAPGYAGVYSPAKLNTAYVAVYNTTGTEAGKWGMYEIGANAGNKLTATARLASGGTLGGVTWDDDLNTQDHPEGSIVVPVNASGVPYGHTIWLARGAGVRAYGLYGKKPFIYRDPIEGHIQDVHIYSAFGQDTRHRTNGDIPSFQVVTHAMDRDVMGVPNLPEVV